MMNPHDLSIKNNMSHSNIESMYQDSYDKRYNEGLGYLSQAKLDEIIQSKNIDFDSSISFDDGQ